MRVRAFFLVRVSVAFLWGSLLTIAHAESQTVENVTTRGAAVQRAVSSPSLDKAFTFELKRDDQIMSVPFKETKRNPVDLYETLYIKVNRPY